MKTYANIFGHIIKMTTNMVKNLLNLLQNQKADDLGTWYVAFGM